VRGKASHNGVSEGGDGVEEEGCGERYCKEVGSVVLFNQIKQLNLYKKFFIFFSFTNKQKTQNDEKVYIRAGRRVLHGHRTTSGTNLG